MTLQGQDGPATHGQDAHATPERLLKHPLNKVGFEPVKTDALKIEINLQARWSAGVQEVVIE